MVEQASSLLENLDSMKETFHTGRILDTFIL